MTRLMSTDVKLMSKIHPILCIEVLETSTCCHLSFKASNVTFLLHFRPDRQEIFVVFF